MRTLEMLKNREKTDWNFYSEEFGETFDKIGDEEEVLNELLSQDYAIGLQEAINMVSDRHTEESLKGSREELKKIKPWLGKAKEALGWGEVEIEYDLHAFWYYYKDLCEANKKNILFNYVVTKLYISGLTDKEYLELLFKIEDETINNFSDIKKEVGGGY